MGVKNRVKIGDRICRNCKFDLIGSRKRVFRLTCSPNSPDNRFEQVRVMCIDFMHPSDECLVLPVMILKIDILCFPLLLK